GRTENIRVRSIVGRFLEHSRVFYFANGSEDPLDGEFLIGSADWMYRNLAKRIEVISPVQAIHAKAKLWEVLDLCLKDQRQAWKLDSDGRYTRLSPAEDDISQTVGIHQILMQRSLERNRQ